MMKKKMILIINVRKYSTTCDLFGVFHDVSIRVLSNNTKGSKSMATTLHLSAPTVALTKALTDGR